MTFVIRAYDMYINIRGTKRFCEEEVDSPRKFFFSPVSPISSFGRWHYFTISLSRIHFTPINYLADVLLGDGVSRWKEFGWKYFWPMSFKPMIYLVEELLDDGFFGRQSFGRLIFGPIICPVLVILANYFYWMCSRLKLWIWRWLRDKFWNT